MQLECHKSIKEKIERVDWKNLQTVYGSAEVLVPKSLHDLYCSDINKAIKASGFLWGSLCRNNSFIPSASLPSYEIICNRIKENCNEKLKIELLDLIFSFACCTNQKSNDDNYKFLLKKMKFNLIKDKSFFEDLMKCEQSNTYTKVFAEEILYQLRS